MDRVGEQITLRPARGAGSLPKNTVSGFFIQGSPVRFCDR
jgi:hypothetical protein